MAGDSAGRIQLDLEVKGNLSQQIESTTKGLGSGLKKSISNSFRGAFSGIKKDTKSSMEGVSKSITSAVTNTVKSIKSQVGSIGKGLGKGLQAQSKPSSSNITKQSEAIQRQKMLVDELTRKYEQMMSGGAEPKALRVAENELKRLEVDLANTQKEWDALDAKMQSMSTFKGVGVSASDNAAEMARIEAQLDTLGAKMANSDERATLLKKTISQLKMDPSASAEAQTLADKIHLAKEKLERLQSSTSSTGSGAKKSSGFFKDLADKIRSAGSQATRAKGSFNSLNSSSNGLGKSIFRLGNMLKMMLVRKALQGMIAGAREGMQNLAQYCSSTNASMSSLMSSMTKLKNSFATAFAPILNVVAPILSTLINMLATAISYVSAFFAALSGQTSFTRAVGVTQDYAASLSGAGGAAAGANEATKEYQKTLAGFDEVNKLESDKDTGSSGGGGGAGGGLAPSDMFETAEIDNKVSTIADKIKNIAAQIFKPFQEAWDKEGQNTINSVKKSLSSIWELVKEIGNSFLTVWTNGTGTQMLITILQITQDIFNSVGSLADQFRKAWAEAGVGTSIVQGVFDIFQIVLSTIKEITGATAEWARTIDFSPVLVAIDGLLQAIQPLIQIVGDLLAWVYTELLLPLASWAIEEAAPASVDLLSEAFGVLTSVLKPVVEGIKKLWSHLEPIVKWIGEFAIQVIKDFGEILRDTAVVFDEKGEQIEQAFEDIGKVISFIWDFSLKPRLDAFKALVALVFQFVSDYISNKIRSVVEVISGLAEALSGLTTFISGVFTGDWSKAWDGLAKIVSGTWTAIKGHINSIIGGIEGMANGVVRGINTMIRALNRLKFSIPSWVPGLGGKSLGFNISEISSVSIPRLATGGVVDSPTLAMVGENGQEAVVPLEKNTQGIDKIASLILENMNGHNSEGISKHEFEAVMNLAVLKIVNALESLGFYIDSELLAKAVKTGQAKMDRRYSTVVTT